jgi:hypothetical protein
MPPDSSGVTARRLTRTPLTRPGVPVGHDASHDDGNRGEEAPYTREIVSPERDFGNHWKRIDQSIEQLSRSVSIMYS